MPRVRPRLCAGLLLSALLTVFLGAQLWLALAPAWYGGISFQRSMRMWCFPKQFRLPTFVVSLPHASGRRETLRAEGLTTGVFDVRYMGAKTKEEAAALMASMDDVPTIASLRGRTSVRFSADWFASLACTVSHLEAVSAALDSRVSYALILEDDVVVRATLRLIWNVCERQQADAPPKFICSVVVFRLRMTG